MLHSLVQRSQRNTGVPLGESFMRRKEAADAPPPLAQLLRGGRGGEVRLKLYLTMLLLAVSPPYGIPPVPGRSWAQALGLPDPERSGARRVNDAIDWLSERRFLMSERRKGTHGSVRLLSQAGTGDPYIKPTGSGRYMRLPLGFWDQGWIARLSGTAVAVLIVLLDMQTGRVQPQWISPGQARRRYDLSACTWTKGLGELRELEVVTVSRLLQGDLFDYRRMRNAYWVREEVFRESATPPAQAGGGEQTHHIADRARGGSNGSRRNECRWRNCRPLLDVA